MLIILTFCIRSGLSVSAEHFPYVGLILADQKTSSRLTYILNVRGKFEAILLELKTIQKQLNFYIVFILH